jgi:acyl-coenzyme A thioesterase PaaI-like protein
MRVDYLHQGIGHSFHASGKVVRLGGRIASAQMELKNDAGLLIATGTAAYVIS